MIAIIRCFTTDMNYKLFVFTVVLNQQFKFDSYDASFGPKDAFDYGHWFR